MTDKLSEKSGKLSFHDWLRGNEVLGYVFNAYGGVEPVPSSPAVMRRVFIWEENSEIKMGNTEAFVLHLGRHFNRKTSPVDASLLHELFREYGASITPHKHHAVPRPDGPHAGHFKQPDPDEWSIS